MPASSYTHISTVVHFLQAIWPKRVLDVGIGNGAYGLLARQYLDVAHERVLPESWQHTIDGVEIFEAYRNPVWAFAYNRVTIGDARQVIASIENYDLILFNDVLEHVEREEARSLIRAALDRCKCVVATTPSGHYPQGAWGGNEAERHLCTLGPKDFDALIAMVRTGDTSCFVCSRDPESIERIKDAAAGCPGWRPSRARTLLRRIVRKSGKMLDRSR
jgi:hypothetical protein